MQSESVPGRPPATADEAPVEQKLGSAGGLLFTLGDYAGGALIGTLTAAAVHAVVPVGTDMVLAMLIGMAVGTIVHLMLGFLLTPVLGAFHAMVPGSLIGMYGGMLFGMRDSMQRVSLMQACLVGAAFGLITVAALGLYDRALRAASTPAA